MASLPMTYLNNGNYTEALNWVMTDYIGFGIIYMLIGLVVFGVVYSKSGSYGISGMVFIAYSILVAAALPPEIQKYFLLIIGLLATVLLVKIYYAK